MPEGKLFTERLKGGGKWVFLVLAIVFAASFVLFGVGSTGSVGLQDILQSGGDGGGATTEVEAGDLKDALAASTATPNDPTVWVRLGQAYQASAAEKSAAGDLSGAHDEYGRAVEAWERARDLKASDVDTLKGLATAYAAQSSSLQSEIQQIEERARAISSGLSPISTLLPTGPLATLDPITQARDSQISAAVSALRETETPLQDRSNEAILAAHTVWEKLVELRVDDPAIWFEFGGASLAAQSAVPFTDTAAGDGYKADAIRAYKKFVELAPGDPLAEQVQATIDQLEGKPAPTDTTAATTADEPPAATSAEAGTTTAP